MSSTRRAVWGSSGKTLTEMILLSAPGMSDAVILYVHKVFDLEKCVKQHRNNIKKRILNLSCSHPPLYLSCIQWLVYSSGELRGSSSPGSSSLLVVERPVPNGWEQASASREEATCWPVHVAAC